MSSGNHPSRLTLWLGAFTGFYRPRVEEIRQLDPVSRFLYAARSVILVISAQAAIIAGLLAAADHRFHWAEFSGIFTGFIVAHMISNLSNDYFGYKYGHDVPDSPRMRYTVHPLASGVLETRTLLTGLLVLVVLGLALAGAFIAERGWLAVAFFVAGTGLMFWYDAVPRSLKRIGLGEFAVLLVWGPVMIGGGYAMIAGTLSSTALLASLPYGLGVMSILIGKHIDQAGFDASMGIRTLPVLLGDHAARTLNIAAIALMYLLIASLILAHRLSPFTVLTFIALPRAIHAIHLMSSTRPAAAPRGYIGWPLWYHRACLTHNRLFGWLYILGLSMAAIWPRLDG